MRKLYPLLSVSIVLLVILALTGWLVSCQEKEEFVPLKIFSVEPSEALIGDTILITGEGFSPGIRYNHVIFPGAGRHVTPAGNSTERRLWVTVPEKAQSGPVTVNLFDEEVAESPVVLTVKSPVIESVEPAEGIAGDTVTIRGSNFRPEKDKNAVRFNPEIPTTSGATVVSISGTALKVIVPLDARTGKVSVLGFEGPEFTIFPPMITKVEPLECIVGDTITISGRGFGTDHITTDVLFSGSTARATILPGNTSKALRVIVDENAVDGPITLRYGDYELASAQSVTVYPSITDISPRSGPAGTTTVTIDGYGFRSPQSANTVKFGGLASTRVTFVSTKQLKAVVPAGAQTGSVTAEVNGRAVSGPVPVFQVSAAGDPVMVRLNPASGSVGSLMSIEGDYFSTVPAENIVRFGGDVVAEVLEASKNLLKVQVPIGAVTGTVMVTVAGKESAGLDFTVTNRDLPFITKISPAFVEPGSQFTIEGGNFAEFAKDIALSIQSGDAGNRFSALTASATMITAVMPADLPAGEYPLQLTQYGDAATSPVTIARTPEIQAMSPTEGSAGTVVVLTGQHFHNIDNKNIVKFGTTEAIITDGSNNDRNKISVKVPDLPRGTYNVTVSAFGDKISNSDKTFLVKVKPVNVKDVYYARRTQETTGSASPATFWIEKAFYDDQSQQDRSTIYTENTATSNPSVHIRSLVVDFADEKVYFSLGAPGASTNVLPIGNTLKWRKLDGSTGGSMVLANAGSQSKTAYTISDLSLDAANDILYCARNHPPANPTNWELLKGTVTESATDFFTKTVLAFSATAGSNGAAIRGLTYVSNNKLYICEQTSGTTTRISTIDLTATAPVTPVAFDPAVTIPAGGGTVIVDMKIDYNRKKMFMLCANATSFSTHTRRRIVVADLNDDRTGIVGSVREFLNIETDETLANINGIALDTEHEYVYWIKQTTETTTVRPSGVYRKRYDEAPIPGSAPDGNPANNLVVELVYNVPDQGAPNVNIFGGLSIKESGGSATQRRRTASQRISMNLAVDFNLHEDQ